MFQLFELDSPTPSLLSWARTARPVRLEALFPSIVPRAVEPADERSGDWLKGMPRDAANSETFDGHDALRGHVLHGPRVERGERDASAHADDLFLGSLTVALLLAPAAMAVVIAAG